jgi:hypothetical protein
LQILWTTGSILGYRSFMAKTTINKSQFIRSFPADTSPAEIVAAAKAKGISFSPNYVSTIRTASQKKAKKSGGAVVAKRKPGRPKGSKNKVKAPAAVRASAPASGSAESTFKKLVLDLGTTRARELLDQVQKALAKIVA